MVDPTFLSETWKNKDAGEEPPAYTSPCLIYRLNDPETALPDKGIQLLVQPEGHGLYALSRIEFTLPHHSNQRSSDPENITPLAHGLSADEAVLQVFEQLGRELQTARYTKEITPQAWKIRTPAFLPDSLPLAEIRSRAQTGDRAMLNAIFDRLSSQWGKKTTEFHDLPRQKRPSFDFLWS